MIQKLFLTFALFFSTTLSLAQSAALQWYFGRNAGIDFTTGMADTLGALHSDEGCATTSTGTGQLLFYTDGRTVFNAEHEVMQQGTGLNGNPQCAQAAVIVQQPGENHLFYVFTNDAHTGSNGLQYSVVDMQQDSGRGAVVQKNIPLATGLGEQLTLTHQGMPGNYWLLARAFGGQDIYAWSVSDTGIAASPVISQGVVNTGGASYNSIGSMKVSKTIDRLAISHRGLGKVEVFAFDAQTGIASNGYVLTGFTNNACYGVEFDPDGLFLYISERTPNGQLLQYDLMQPTPTDVQASKSVLAAFGTSQGALQIGPDDRIYHTVLNATHIGRINAPNLPGVQCAYDPDAFDLEGPIARLGLPQYLPGAGVAANASMLGGGCAGEPVVMAALTTTYDSLLWDFGDTLSGAANFSTDSIASHLYPGSGIWEVTLTVYHNGQSDSTVYPVIINPVLLNPIPGDTVACQGSVLELETNYPGLAVLWSTGVVDSVLMVTEPGAYWVESTGGTCVENDTVHVHLMPVPALSIVSDTMVCEGDSISVNLSAFGGSVLWENGDTNALRTLNTPGVYGIALDSAGCTRLHQINFEWLMYHGTFLGPDTSICESEALCLDIPYPDPQVSWSSGQSGPVLCVEQATTVYVDVEALGCQTTDTITVTTRPVPQPQLGADTAFCVGTPLALVSKPIAVDAWQWDNGHTEAMRLVDRPGRYWLYATLDGCTGSDTIVVTALPAPIPAQRFDTITCSDGLVTIQPGFTGIEYLWSDGSTAPVKTVGPGVYTVEVAVNECVVQDTVIVREATNCGCKLFAPNAFTPNGDGRNDTFAPITECEAVETELVVYNRWGELVFRSTEPGAKWDGRMAGTSVQTGTYVWQYRAVLQSWPNPQPGKWNGTVTVLQ